MEISKISLEKAISEVCQDTFEKYDPQKDQFETISKIEKYHSDLLSNHGRKYFTKIASEGIIASIKENARTVYSLYSIDKYNFLYQKFKEHYLTLAEVLKVLGYQKKNTSPYSHIERFLYMKENGYMNVIRLNHKVDQNEYFVSKIETANFRANYISFPEAASEANISMATLQQEWVKNYSKPIAILNKKDKNFFYFLRNDWTEYLLSKKKANYLTTVPAANVLGLSTHSFEKVVKEYNIQHKLINKLKHYLIEDLEVLKEKQVKLWNNTMTNFFTKEEASEKLGIQIRTHIVNQEIESIFVPPLMCIVKDGINYKKGREKLYSKKDVEKIASQRKLSQTISSMEMDSYSVVLTALNETNLSFSDNGKKTEEYWKKYIKKKSSSSKASSISKVKDIRVYFNTSKLLIEMTTTKEIYMYSSNELKLAIFKADIPSNTKLEVYKFLKVVSDSRIALMEHINFKVDSLPNPYVKIRKKKDDKSIYTIDQFVNLIDYVKDVKIHKQKAIESIIHCKNKQINNHYDSSWLYVMLHLNNAWRHNDITMFPRISLDRIRIGNLDPEKALLWLSQNSLNSNEINEILIQANSIKFIHSKTKKRRYFFCSDELKNAFAHSVILCELRCRISNPLLNTLIDFDNRARSFKEIFKKNFFSDFDHSFNFKSKQMNRTLISYIYSVIKKTTNRNPLEVTKYIRSHSSVETTNIYIDIPQEQMDFITNQLFSLGHFGYAYDALSELILDNSSSEREIKTQQSLMIKEVFGDIHQIEHLASYLKRLTADQDSVRKVLQGYSIEERKVLSNLIKYGQQPAKKEGFQCIYSKCPYPSRDCKKCPFVISHFYALSQLSEDFDKQFNEFKLKFPITTKQGEKIRLSNNLYSYINLISLAVKQFGEENVSKFFNQDISNIKLELGNMPSVKHLVTITKPKKAESN